MELINVTVTTLAEAVKIIEQSKGFKQALIEIRNVTNNTINVEKYKFFKYVFEFIEPKKIDKRWENNSDWYLSYSRRLLRKINGKSVIEYLSEILLDDKYSRRCVFSTFIDSDFIEKNYPELSSIQFTIENDKLNMFAFWRSQEMNFAWALNTLCMLSYQRKLFIILKKKYNELCLGSYTSFVNNIQFDDFNGNDELQKIEKMKFYCSIIDEKGDDYYDKNYKK
jgi:thymidylate synthase